MADGSLINYGFPLLRNGDIIYISGRRVQEFITKILKSRTKPFILVSHGHTDPTPNPRRGANEVALLDDPRYVPKSALLVVQHESCSMVSD